MTLALRISLVDYFGNLFSRISRTYCTKGNEKSLGMLKDALNNYKDVAMIPLTLQSCSFGGDFSDADLATAQYLVNKNGSVVSPMWVSAIDVARGNVGTFAIDFKILFSRGFKALDRYVDTMLEDIYKDASQLQRACRTLSAFLDKAAFHEECLWSLDEKVLQNRIGAETVTTALLAKHLFSELAKEDRGGYTISNDSKGKVLFCPCNKVECNEPILYGGSQFGSEYLWHGKPDIVVTPAAAGGMMNIVIPDLKKAQLGDIQEEERHVVEMNSSPLRVKKAVKHIIAQAITFSFYQNKFQKQYIYPSDFFIPTIAACSTSFDIYMYDTKNDILLRNAGPPIPLWKKYQLRLSSVLQLWMLTNHLLLGPSLNEEDVKRLAGSFGLKKYIDEKRLELIDDTIAMQDDFMAAETPEFEHVMYFHHTKI